MAMNNEEMNEEIRTEEEVTAEETAPEAEVVTEPSNEEKLTAELASVKDQLLRTVAEYDNFRKRAAKEKLELRPVIITDVVKEFLPVMDNLTRALEAECTDAAYKQGVQMIDDSFLEILTKLGVEEIESDGVMFDPSMHQAVQRVESDELESGMVATTFAKGYRIGDRVIRFAMVAVVN
ncbi:MAG: nucleotide exchange factor GrpE [Oscillospiraceae bacterium]|nr:nucleotide exchange factor GrpE [Oscillospiraceae bacterium]